MFQSTHENTESPYNASKKILIKKIQLVLKERSTLTIEDALAMNAESLSSRVLDL